MVCGAHERRLGRRGRTVRTSGFPARFETVVTDVTLADPGTGVAWTAPRLVIEADAFRPNRITARWPDTQTIASPWERIKVASRRFDAGIAFVPARGSKCVRSRRTSPMSR